MDIGGQKREIELDSELLIVMVKDANESKYERQYQSIRMDRMKVVLVIKQPGVLSELTFLFNSYLFHVHVRASNDDAANKKDAIVIAGDIIAKLQIHLMRGEDIGY